MTRCFPLLGCFGPSTVISPPEQWLIMQMYMYLLYVQTVYTQQKLVLGLVDGLSPQGDVSLVPLSTLSSNSKRASTVYRVQRLIQCRTKIGE